MRLSDAKTNGACKTKTMLKRCMLKHYLVYGACAMCQNMYPHWYFFNDFDLVEHLPGMQNMHSESNGRAESIVKHNTS